MEWESNLFFNFTIHLSLTSIHKFYWSVKIKYMIKNLTLAVLLFISFCANAQIKKGTFLVGGQISAGKEERSNYNPSYPIPQPNPNIQNDEYKYVNVGISIGKAIKDNRVIGFNFNTANFNESLFYNSTETSLSKNNRNDAGIFYRSYKKIGKDFYLFGETNALVRFGKTRYNHTTSINNSTVKETGASLSFTPGFAYAISKKFHIELTMQNLAGVQYATSKQEFTNPANPTLKTSSYNINSSLSNGILGYMGIGFRLIL